MIEIKFEIPNEFEETYKKLLKLMVLYGLDLMKDCENGCKQNNRKLIECKNIFFSACAAYNNGNIKVANVLHNFVLSQLNLLYGGNIPNKLLEYEVASESDIDKLF
jgi:hypothetical protein